MRFKNLEEKILRRSSEGKAQREQYMIAVGLDGYIPAFLNQNPMSEVSICAVP